MGSSIDYKATFHPIGQGLFYSITITHKGNPFIMVYDCGNESEMVDRNVVIKNSNIPQVIDLLVISHFHRDHINGIPELMNGRIIKEVVLPYLNPEEKEILSSLINLEYALQGKEEIIDEDLRMQLIELINKPVTFFNTNGSDTTRVNVIDNTTNPTGNNLQNGWSETAIVPSTGSFAKAHLYNHTAFKTVLSSWKFKFYVKKAKQEKLDKLHASLKEASITIENIQSDDLQKYKQIYNNIFPSIERNATSLVCCHGPIQKTRSRGPFSYYHYSDDSKSGLESNMFNILNAKCKGTSPKNCKKSDHYQLLTGDAELNDKSIFKNHYKSELMNVKLFQIPHHGSEKNWKFWFKNILPDGCFYVCPFGNPNKHGHPSANFQNIKTFDVVNNQKSFVLSGQVD